MNPSVADLLRFPAILSRKLLFSAVVSSMGGFGRPILLFLLWLNTATGTDANRNQPQTQFAMHMFRNRAPQFVHKPPHERRGGNERCGGPLICIALLKAPK